MSIMILRLNGEVVIKGDFESISAAVQAAVKSGANLSRADLSGANLSARTFLTPRTAILRSP